MEMYGEYYIINGCHSYPIEVNQLVCFLQSIIKVKKYEASFFRVSHKAFNYYNVMDDLYEFYTVSDNLIQHMYENVFYDIVLETEEGIIIKFIHEYYDNMYYGISMNFSVEQLEERFNESQKIKYLDSMKQAFLTIMEPVYGTIGVEASLQSLKDKEFMISFEQLYISEKTYDKLKAVLDKKLSHQIYLIKLKQGYIVSMESSLSSNDMQKLWNTMIE